jgi:hypothetical protein
VLTTQFSAVAASKTFHDLFINGESIIVPSSVSPTLHLEFLNFRNLSQSGDLNVPLTAMFADPILGGPGFPALEPGLRFSSALWSVADGADYDVSFNFQVRMWNAAGQLVSRLTDNTLAILGELTGPGFIGVAEGVLDRPGNTLASKFVYLTPTAMVLQHHQVFSGGPYSELAIAKDMALLAGPGGLASVSYFDQSFSEVTGHVPEPSTSAAIVALMAMVWGATWRRLQSSSKPA